MHNPTHVTVAMLGLLALGTRRRGWLLPAGGTGLATALALATLAGCVGGDDAEPEPTYGVLSSAATVSTFETSSCSTSVVIEVSRQIADEVGCILPGQLVAFEAGGNLSFTGSAVLPYLAQDAVDDLLAVSAGHTVEINSAFRTVVQQYLLRRWFEQGRCGITAAAQPGRSNHESGRALDLANWPSRVADMASQGWAHDVPGDDVHFDHRDSPDIRGADILAFQRLWNRNHPGDPLDEDGNWGAMTQAKLAASPAEGFPIGAMCDVARTHALSVVDVRGPTQIAPGQRGTFTVTLKNVGTADWTAGTEVGTDGASVFYDPAWASPTTVTTLGQAVAVGATIMVTIDAAVPVDTTDEALSESFRLRDGGETFGAIPLAVTIVGNEGGGGGEHENEDLGDLHAGCAVGGGPRDGGGSLLVGALVLGALVVPSRRTRVG